MLCFFTCSSHLLSCPLPSLFALFVIFHTVCGACLVASVLSVDVDVAGTHHTRWKVLFMYTAAHLNCMRRYCDVTWHRESNWKWEMNAPFVLAWSTERCVDTFQATQRMDDTALMKLSEDTTRQRWENKSRLLLPDWLQKQRKLLESQKSVYCGL